MAFSTFESDGRSDACLDCSNILLVLLRTVGRLVDGALDAICAVVGGGLLRAEGGGGGRGRALFGRFKAGAGTAAGVLTILAAVCEVEGDDVRSITL